MNQLLSWILKRKKGILSLSTTHILNIGVAVLTLPIILSNLPTSEYGQWQFMLALQAWGLIVSAQQITESSKRGIALGKEGTFFYALFKRSKLLLFSSILFLFLFGFFYFTERSTLGYLALLSSVYLFTNILFQTSVSDYFIAKKEFFFSSVWEILSSPLARIGSSLVAFLTHNILFFVLFQVGFALFLSLLAFVFLIVKRGLWKQYRQKNYDPSCLTYGLKFLPINITGAISNRLVEVLIAIFFGFSNLAYFSVARDLRNQIANVLKIVSPLLYAEFVQYPFEELSQLIKKHLKKMIALSTFLATMGVGLSAVYILYFLPESFSVSLPLLLILSLAFPIGIPTISLFTVLDTHLRYKAVAAATIIPNIIEIFLILLLGWFWNIYGMVVAIAIFGYVSFLFYYLATIKRDEFKKFLEQNPLMRTLIKNY